MIRQTHHLTILNQPAGSLKVERVEGKITMTDPPKAGQAIGF
jgi:hypothetical protein